jgi:light-regulated signal transduction histidine kinase (bacteriophytochrome)
MVLANLKAAIDESGAVVTRGPLPTLTVDRQQMVQLMQNLIANAVKFRGERPPSIEVAAEQSGDQYQFSVRDNGIGIPEKHLEDVFVAFRRLHTQDQYPGTGVGLAICKKIVELHNGRIWVESEPGKGTTFYFTIPSLPAAP